MECPARLEGMKVSTDTIVGEAIINAPSSTKNRSRARDPEMRQTKKGNQGHFGMKAHIGVDSKTKLIHSIVATAANEHDKHALPQLLHGNERRVYGDSAYSSQMMLIAQAAPKARASPTRRDSATED